MGDKIVVGGEKLDELNKIEYPIFIKKTLHFPLGVGSLNMANAVFIGCVFTGVPEFHGCDFQDAVFIRCDLESVSFVGCNLGNATFLGCSTHNTTLKACSGPLRTAGSFVSEASLTVL